jgi:hypothetical protein
MNCVRLGAAALTLASLGIASNALALNVTTTSDPIALGDAILGSGSAIYVSSVTYSGAAIASGTYTDGPLGIADGALLTSGSAQNALPPNNGGSTSQNNGLGGHALCDALIPGYQSYDASLLTVTFDLAPGFDGISFNSVFGSEEFPYYVGSKYNDVYGVYLNGTQIAFDENGDPITINGPFFSSGAAVMTPANGTEYNGTTNVLHTKAPLAGGSTNNVLQIVVCDAGDRTFDSGAFFAGLNGCIGEDCTGTVPCTVIDDDGDGSNACDDCDDANPDVNPGAVEACDYLDNNCNAEIDEGGVCAPVCVTIQRGTLGNAADATIWQSTPGYNTGAVSSLATGQNATSYKEALVSFDLGVIPFGATVTSATLGVYQTYTSAPSTVSVHQITAPWSESTVTWNSFAGAYSSTVLGSFNVFNFGIRTVDVTSMVSSWVAGSSDNNGFLLKEGTTSAHTYRSSETGTVSDRPYLYVCYYGGEQ